MDLTERIVLAIIVLTFLSVFVTFYLTEAQCEMPDPEYLQGSIDVAAGIAIFLNVLGFAILLVNRRMSRSTYS